MIDKTLEVLSSAIHDYLVRLPELDVTTQQTVYSQNIVKDDKTLALPDDTLGLTLVNIEEERVVKVQKAFSRASSGRISHVNPELKLNLYILIVANFNDYGTGLQYLSGAIRFFQSKYVFTPDNTPNLDPSIEKLIVEMHSLTFEQQNHLWSCLGANYLPSVMYKVRMIAIQEAQAIDEQEPIQELTYIKRPISVNAR